MIASVTVDEIVDRFGLNDRVALQIWIMLQASRDALLPAIPDYPGYPSQVMKAAVNALHANGYLCWNTRQGWMFGATPLSETGRVLRGQQYLTRDGVRAVMPYAMSFLNTTGGDPIHNAVVRQRLERAYLVSLSNWPQFSARQADGVAKAAAEVELEPHGSIQAWAGCDQTLLYRPSQLPWDFEQPQIQARRWLLREVQKPADLVPSLVVDVMHQGEIVPTSIDVIGIDVVHEMALTKEGSWIGLGYYDQERMTIALMNAFLLEHGRFPRPRDMATTGAIGRPVREEHISMSLASSKDAFGELLHHVRTEMREHGLATFRSSDLRQSDLRVAAPKIG